MQKKRNIDTQLHGRAILVNHKSGRCTIEISSSSAITINHNVNVWCLFYSINQHTLYFSNHVLGAPPYISNLSTVKPKSSYNLRSNSSLLLEPPKEEMLPTLGARSFYAAAPCLSNSLPAELRDILSLPNFKQKLKTHLIRAG